jgi:hypothetical protein
MLTHSPLLYLPRSDPKDGKNLYHYLNHYIHHLRGRRHFYIDVETTEKHLYPLKDVDKCFLACTRILSSLRNLGVTMANTKARRKIDTH